MRYQYCWDRVAHNVMTVSVGFQGRGSIESVSLEHIRVYWRTASDQGKVLFVRSRDQGKQKCRIMTTRIGKKTQSGGARKTQWLALRTDLESE